MYKLERTRHNIMQGTYTLGRFLAHASILCIVMGSDQNKESFLYPGVGSICLGYCSSQKSAYTFCVNEIRLGAGIMDIIIRGLSVHTPHQGQDSR